MGERTADLLERLRGDLERADIDALVLNPGPTLRYLTGHEFTSHERLFLLVVPRWGAPFVVLPLLEEGNWRAAVPEVDAVFLWDDAEGPSTAAGRAFSQLTTARRVAIEPLQLRYFELVPVQRHLDRAQIVAADAMVQNLRLCKSAEEVAWIRAAARIAEAALESVLLELRVGISEREVAAMLSSRLLERGGEQISFSTIALGGPNSALPHGVPGARPIGAGELLLLDFGTSSGGYHCDITRTVAVGAQPPDRVREVYQAVLHANERGRQASRPGVTAGEVHELCQRDLHDPRWGEFMKHRTGHGLGLEVHEPPSIMAGNPQLIEVGMVYTVEPGLYLEGLCGVRIEDDVWIVADGHESLTTFPRELRVVGI
jgi:Xaa-Pro dipeptidase